MLPNLRVVVAAVFASLLLILTAFGLAATVRIAQHAKVGPIEPARMLAYAETDDWELIGNLAPETGAPVANHANHADRAVRTVTAIIDAKARSKIISQRAGSARSPAAGSAPTLLPSNEAPEQAAT